MAPRYDDKGALFEFNEQRGFFIEMDKFEVTRKYL